MKKQTIKNLLQKFVLFLPLIIILTPVYCFWHIHRDFWRVHPDEVQVRDWILQVKGGYTHDHERERHITHVFLNNTKISDEDIQRLQCLKKIKQLQINNTKTTNNAIPYINNLKTLIFLSIEGTDITNVNDIDIPGLAMISLTPGERYKYNRPSTVSPQENEDTNHQTEEE